jgi:hypothetical protein
MKKLLKRKIVEQDGICAICDEPLTDYSDVVPDHKEPKGMGGAWRDDIPRTSKLHIGSAMKRRDQQEWTADGRSVFMQGGPA